MLELVYGSRKKVEEVKIGEESYKRGDRKCFGDWGVVSTIRDNRKIIMKYKKMDLPESSWGFFDRNENDFSYKDVVCEIVLKDSYGGFSVFFDKDGEEVWEC
jgi:hypothetical protein